MDKEDIKREIGHRINNARKQLKLTIKELAERTNCLKPARITNWENGLRTPDPASAIILAAVLGVSPAYLMCLSDDVEMGNVARLIPLVTNSNLLSNDLISASARFPVHADVITNSEQAFAMRVADESMAPDFKPGEITIFSQNTKPKPGQYVIAVNKKTDSIIFRVYRDRGQNTFELVPLNNDWATEYCDHSNSWEIIAVMLEHHKKA